MKVTISIIFLLVTTPLIASNVNFKESENKASILSLYNRSNNLFQNTDELESYIDFLDITPTEYSRYLELRQQYKGLISGNITPLEYLGIFSTNQQDQKKYAYKYSKLMHEATTKTLEFDRLVQITDRELYGAENRIFNSVIGTKNKIARRSHTINISECNEQCINIILKKLNDAIKTPIDLFFLNTDDSSIREFAAYKLNVKPALVESGFITLNHAQ